MPSIYCYNCDYEHSMSVLSHSSSVVSPSDEAESAVSSAVSLHQLVSWSAVPAVGAVLRVHPFGAQDLDLGALRAPAPSRQGPLHRVAPRQLAALREEARTA